MTKEQCRGLALLLLDAVYWLEDTDPGNLDAELLNSAVDAVNRILRRLELDGER